MKVHYNLLSVSGGGGVHHRMNESQNQKEERLISEIKAFMDHPALLAWYISDEQMGIIYLPDTGRNIQIN